MPTGTTLETRLRESAAEFTDIYNQMAETSLFAGLTQEVDASLGFFKPAAISLIGEPEEFNGEAVINGMNSLAQTYATRVFQYTWGLDVNVISRTDRLARGSVTSQLRSIVRKWIGHKDKLLTTLLATGESTGSLSGTGSTAIFGTTVPTTNPSVTVNNKHGTATSGSANEFLAAFHAGRALFRGMRNAGNDLVRASLPRLGVMYSPTGQTGEEQFIFDALKPMLLNDKYKFAESEIIPMANPYLGVNADCWMWDLEGADKFFAVGVEQMPDFVTNLGSQSDSDRIIFRRNIGATSYVYNVAFTGNPYQGVMLNDA